MDKTPNSMRMHIGIFGCVNAGKSTLFNALVGQDVSIVSNLKGTTTDSVKKAFEIDKVGAVLFIDTAGIDDESSLGKQRVSKTMSEIDRINLAIMVLKNRNINKYELDLIDRFIDLKIPILFVINKTKDEEILDSLPDSLNKFSKNVVILDLLKDDVDEIYSQIYDISSLNFKEKKLFDGILSKDELAILITPIDRLAPKGRMILPQVQSLREILDLNCDIFVSQSCDINALLKKLTVKPSLVVADSKCILEVIKNSPKDLKITTFSILMARLKGDLEKFIDGANKLDNLKPNDKILIVEACSHQYIEGDIAKTKIPKLLEAYLGFKPNLSYAHKFSDLDEFDFIIHCGGCMINEKTMLNRQNIASSSQIPMTNFGILISKLQGVLDRVVEIF